MTFFTLKGVFKEMQAFFKSPLSEAIPQLYLFNALEEPFNFVRKHPHLRLSAQSVLMTILFFSINLRFNSAELNLQLSKTHS